MSSQGQVPRFFIPPDWLKSDEVVIKGEPAHQIHHVLRLKVGEHVVVLDNTGLEYDVQLEKVGGDLVQGRVVGKGAGTAEPGIKITLYQALLKADKFEFVLQKGVELGVSAFIPFVSERCVVQKPGANKITRWQKIVQEAAEQSRRALMPALHETVSFSEACKLSSGPSILLWEGEEEASLSLVIKNARWQNALAVNVFVGPEGGFPSSEVDSARRQGITAVGLGRRILRAEAAGLAAISAILYDRGEFG